MSDDAVQKKFRAETIAGFEKRQSLTRRTVITETEINGNEATFLVADSGGATAVTRGLDGDIPTRPDNLNQYTATLKEWHDVPERTKFNIYTSQGNGREIMQRTCISVINRKIDKDIHAELETATVTWGSSAIVTLPLIITAKTKLANAFADEDAEVFALITPAFHGYMIQFPSFASADYVDARRFGEGVSMSKAFNWYGVTWIVDAGLTDAGGGDAECYMYSQNAIGHACDTENLDVAIGYDDKNQKSWARCSTFMGSALLQNAGVIKMPHIDTAYS